MKKLFKAIRQNDLEEVKAILEKQSEAIACTAMPLPKKDMGLKVAVKTPSFEIAYYLMEQGADVNFMESEEEGSDWRTPVLHDAIRSILHSLCHRQPEVSNEALKLTEELLRRGADTNKCASNGFAALDECVADAEYILERRNAFVQIQEVTGRQLCALLDLLLAYGADFVPVEDRAQKYTIHGREMETVIKGDIDRTEHTRAVMQAYCREHGLMPR